ncbi:hypothetical protein ABFS83_11G099000 [Erythranthe nasuta]
MIMSPANNKPSAGKDDRRTPSSAAAAAAAARPPQEPALKCPRCDSPNTKFCYYNNYSLAQPRHFCKTCRRYWTRGGALRNVPIGGGCRKNKKSSKSSSSPRLSTGGDSMDNSAGSARDGNGGLKFFQGISPAMDFQLGGGTAAAAAMMINFPTAPLYNQFSHFGDLSNTCGAISSTPCFTAFDPSATTSSPPLMGFNFPFSSPLIKQGENNFQSNLASSIESLSSINQDLHWKLQQQRLSMMFVGDHHHHQRENNAAVAPPPSNIGTLIPQKPQPILFQNLDVSKADESCGAGSTQRRDHCGGGNQNLSTEWFFDNSSYAAVTPTPASSGSNVNDQNNSGNWSNLQAWSDLNQYASLP